jgi:hypothetical protein
LESVLLFLSGRGFGGFCFGYIIVRKKKEVGSYEKTDTPQAADAGTGAGSLLGCAYRAGRGSALRWLKNKIFPETALSVSFLVAFATVLCYTVFQSSFGFSFLPNRCICNQFFFQEDFMPNFTHSLNVVGRCTQMQRSQALSELGIGGGQVPYLFRICRLPEARTDRIPWEEWSRGIL